MAALPYATVWQKRESEAQMSTYRVVAYIVLGSILGAAVAAVLPGMQTAVAIALGAGVGVAVSSAAKPRRRAADRPDDSSSSTPVGR
ncbi:MAG: hypothetical protein QOE31_2794 [Solirubrobacteraceae bacterium]|nr:hypothetical protein [Solirubrobacteraceae bacterium]